MPLFGAERFPTFVPSLATITAFERAENPSFVTAFANTFLVGEYVSFLIPQEYGMVQLNGKTALIIDRPNDVVVQVNIDTTNFDTFTVPLVPTQSAQAIPAGEVATTLLGANKNILPYP